MNKLLIIAASLLITAGVAALDSGTRDKAVKATDCTETSCSDTSCPSCCDPDCCLSK